MHLVIPHGLRGLGCEQLLGRSPCISASLTCLLVRGEGIHEAIHHHSHALPSRSESRYGGEPTYSPSFLRPSGRPSHDVSDVGKSVHEPVDGSATRNSEKAFDVAEAPLAMGSASAHLNHCPAGVEVPVGRANRRKSLSKGRFLIPASLMKPFTLRVPPWSGRSDSARLRLRILGGRARG